MSKRARQKKKSRYRYPIAAISSPDVEIGADSTSAVNLGSRGRMRALVYSAQNLWQNRAIADRFGYFAIKVRQNWRSSGIAIQESADDRWENLTMVASMPMVQRKSRGRAYTRLRRGGSIIEFSIVLPVLLFIVLGMTEFGQYFYIRSAFVAAARDVARASCLSTAQSGDPVTRATATLAQANVTFNSSWMTIVDASNSNATISDVSAVSVGHQVVVTISTQYSSIPNAYRPLYAFTGHGIGNGKMCSGQCMMVKE